MKGWAHNLSRHQQEFVTKMLFTIFVFLHVTCPVHHSVDCMNESSCFLYSRSHFYMGCAATKHLHILLLKICPSCSSFCMMHFITCSYLDLIFFSPWALFFQFRIPACVGILSWFVSFIPKTFPYYFIHYF